MNFLIVQGVVYPACHGIWRFWAPPAERSRLATMAFCGSYAGIVIGMPISGFLAQYISWKAPFYFYSICGIFWYAAWLWLVFERPRVHPTITLEEMKYIEKSLGENTQHSMPTLQSTPFADIAKSKPVHAIVVANFCRSWNFYMLVLYQNKFMERRFQYTTSKAGILSALPHLVMTLIVPFGGVLADQLRKSGTMSTTNVRYVPLASYLIKFYVRHLMIYSCSQKSIQLWWIRNGRIFLFVGCTRHNIGKNFNEFCWIKNFFVSIYHCFFLFQLFTVRCNDCVNVWCCIQWICHIRLQCKSFRHRS